MRSLLSLLAICLVSAIASADEQRNNFLRNINRRVQEDNNNSTANNDSDGTTTATTTTTICEPCPVCDAQPSSTISTNSTSSSEKIKLRFLVAERDFARLQVMLEQMADDYTRKASLRVA